MCLAYTAGDLFVGTQAESGEEGMLAVLGLLTPLLRTLANVAALGGRDACSEVLSNPACKADLQRLAKHAVLHLCIWRNELGHAEGSATLLVLNSSTRF